MTFQVVEEFGNLLSGKIAARQHFAIACGKLAGLRSGEIVVLDFKDVDYVSGSWINWMLVPLVRYTSEESNDYYIVLSNFPSISLDDLQLISEVEHTPFLAKSCGQADSITIVGQLDPIQMVTLKAVQKNGLATGASLSDDQVQATTWNNRLRDLHVKRLLRRRKQGREQVYSLAIPEVHFDG